MALSAFLQSKKEACRALVEALGRHFDYVSILGTDVKATSVRVNRQISNVGEDSGSTECGFVLKLNSGRAFFEYSLDDITGDIEALSDRIVAELVIDPSLVDACIQAAPIADEPLVESFERPSDLADFDEATLLAHCNQIKDQLLAADEHIVNAMVIIRTLNVHKLFVSTNKMLDQNYAWVNAYSIITYRDGDKMISAREGANGPCLGPVLERLPTRTPILVDKARHLITATPIEPGIYDVITDPSITGLIAHEAFGHGVEMDMFVKDRALAKQFVGDYVAAPIVSMRDGAASCLSVASYFFDDDGVPAHDTQIIKDGILVAGISDLGSASVLGTEPTGNGRRESYKRKAYSRMTNTFFEPGQDKLEDMIASIKHGYMIFETNNGMEDPKNWAIQCVAEYGIEIVDGKLTDHYVSPVVISGYVPDLLKSITMISDDFVVEGSGSCGKGHKEWVRVSDGGPALKARVKLG